jgi:hypothetical protein
MTLQIFCGCSVLQTRYDALERGSALPLSLYDDVVRITKLARVGQADLYDAIRTVSFAAQMDFKSCTVLQAHEDCAWCL